jgi:Spy/CpxP family protein refolding chaperone
MGVTRLCLGVLMLPALSSVSEAQPFGRGLGPGDGAWGPAGGCPCFVLQTAPDLLKAQLGVTDAQLKRLGAIRDKLATRRVDLLAALDKEQIKLQTLWYADLPDKSQVLRQQRNVRVLRNKLSEEHAKAHLEILRVLTRSQRAKLRSGWAGSAAGTGWAGGSGRGCPDCGWGPGWGRGRGSCGGGWGRGWGRGRGRWGGAW